MKIRIELNWRALHSPRTNCENALAKTIDMPGAPQRGMLLYPTLPESPASWFANSLVVDVVFWDEDNPDIFTVSTNIVDVDCEAEEFRKLMQPLGWA